MTSEPAEASQPSRRNEPGPEGELPGIAFLPWLLVLAVVPTVLLAGLVYLEESRAEEAHVQERIEELAELRKMWVTTHAASLDRAARILAARAGAEVPPGSVDPPIGVGPGWTAEDALRRLVGVDSTLLGAALLGRDGSRLASWGSAAQGSTSPPPDPTAATWEEPLTALAPLPDPPGLAEIRVVPLPGGPGEPLYLEIFFSGAELLRIATDTIGLGLSGETVMGTRASDGTLLTIGPLRYDGHEPLAAMPGTDHLDLPLLQAVEGREGYLPDIRDYRGVSVAASTRHIEGPGWGLVVKRDRAEALASVAALGRTLLLGGGMISVGFVILAIVVGTRARRIQESLRRSGERFRALFQNAPIGMARVSVDGRFQEANPALLELMGYDLETLLDRRVKEVTHPDDWPQEQAPVRDMLRGRQEGFQLRKRFLRADGSVLHSRSTVSAVRDPDGRVRYYVAEVEDISSEEEAIRRMEEALDRLEATVDATPMPLFELDPDGRVRRWNDSAEEVFGWTEEEAVGRILPSVPQDDLSSFHRIRSRILEGKRVHGVELVRRRKDGSLLPVRAYGAPVVGRNGQVLGIVGLLEDVRDEQAREKELRSLNRALRFISESNMAVVRSEGRSDLLRRVGTIAVETGGYSAIWIATRSDASRGWAEFRRGSGAVGITSLPGFLDELEGARTVGIPFVAQTLGEEGGAWGSALAAEGHRSLAAIPFPTNPVEEGVLILTHAEEHAFDPAELGVLEELTSDLAHGLQVAALRNRLTMIQVAVESLDLGVVIVDAAGPDHSVSFANQGVAKTMGWPPPEVVGRPATFFLDATTDEAEYHEFRAALAAGRSYQGAMTARQKSGETFWDRVTLHPVLGPRGGVEQLVCIHEDVTEQKLLGEEVEHRARLAAVGELAGGVAHDFRNILTATQGLAQLSLEEGRLPESVQENLKEIDQVVARGKAVTERLLALSRRGTREPEATAVTELLTELLSVVGHTLRDNIELVTDIPEDEQLRVEMDPDQFTQAVFNLVRNAEQAMPHGGRLTIRALNPVPEEVILNPRLILEDPRPGDWLLLTLEDTGVGMDAGTLERAFDPYFTTKPAGEGTGLGLASVQGVVERMSGHLWMTSEPGVGTEVHILLPVTDPEPEEVEPVAGTPKSRRTVTHATILLAEDDPTVLRVFTRALERHGFSVLPALDGAEALRVFEEDPEAVDLVITDGIMPRISGAGLADRVWHTRPTLPIIVTSGFGAAELRQDFPEEPPAPLLFLPKPLQIEELMETLGSLLGGSTADDDSDREEPR